ncbi:hypothetical protein [Paenibacillus xylanexedens]|uniref:hypothetical protein n=1 Tax=Paenibacillus xylanexedens TaxID=528191 RepID=UPI0011A0B7F2|nr:hypothetical protein [Paenibacillus xylanexedens]
MARYSDEEIRSMSKITIKIAADYLKISPNMLTLGMRNDLLPIGFAIRNEDRYRESWSYTIVPERLIAYNHGKINAIQVENIEKNLNTIINQFEEMKRDLVFLLSENEGLEGSNNSTQSLHRR